MGINLSNFLSSKSKNARMIDFQDLDHVDGLSISVVSVQICIMIIEMTYPCSILEKEQIMRQFTRSQK
jgi:hypothetical protein